MGKNIIYSTNQVSLLIGVTSFFKISPQCFACCFTYHLTNHALGNNQDTQIIDAEKYKHSYKEQDLSRPYDPRHSFASSVSSVTKHNLSESFCGEENTTTSTAGLTPSRNGSVAGGASTQQQHPVLGYHGMIDSPHETVPLHYYLQMNTANCSPIPGIPEEDADQISLGGNSYHSTRKINKSLASTRTNDSASSSGSNSAFPSRLVGDHSKGDSAGESGRPMPDMNAFDGSNIRLKKSLSHVGDGSGDLRSRHTKPKLYCPPTPARTPAWACDADENPEQFILFTQRLGMKKKKMERQNSLISTKVLATCSPQVLDGRASLENSALEEKSDTSSVVMITEDPGSLSCSNITSTTNQRRVSNGTTATNASQPSTHLPTMKHSRRQKSSAVGCATDRGQLKVDSDHTDIEDDDTENESEHRIVGRCCQQVEKQPLVISMAECFDVLSTLGRGNFADVYRVRSKQNGNLYAVKRVRQQFRGKRDRETALAEVRSMQRLQSHMAASALSEQQQEDHQRQRATHHSLYLLFFFQAWQEEGHFYCQTELCCRDTCREVMDSLRSHWQVAKAMYPSINLLPPTSSSRSGSHDGARWMPEDAIWKMCHDIGAGLSYIHSHGFVHNDIKPSNIFFVRHPRFGALCKIGDFGMARTIGSSEDGQEGDQKYMALELLDSGVKMHPSADIFSLGLTLYEMASNLSFVVPSEGPRWHEIRSGRHVLDVPSCRSVELKEMVRKMIHVKSAQRPSAATLLSSCTVTGAGRQYNRFLHDYILDVEKSEQQEEAAAVLWNGQTPRHSSRTLCSPTFGLSVPFLHSSPAHAS